MRLTSTSYATQCPRTCNATSIPTPYALRIKAVDKGIRFGWAQRQFLSIVPCFLQSRDTLGKLAAPSGRADLRLGFCKANTRQNFLSMDWGIYTALTTWPFLHQTAGVASFVFSTECLLLPAFRLSSSSWVYPP